MYQDDPPYELIRHNALAAEEVLALKRFEEVFDLYYNAGHFRFTLARLLAAAPGWDVFQALAQHLSQHGPGFESRALDERTRHLRDVGRAWLPDLELTDLLKLDYCFHHRTRHVPAFLNDRAVEEPTEVRQRRRGHPDTAFAPFRHEILWEGAAPRLLLSPAPRWYAFHYPDAARGYFFRPRMEAVLPAAVA